PEYGAKQLDPSSIPSHILYSQPLMYSQNGFKPQYLDSDLVIIPDDDIDTKIIPLGTNDSLPTNIVTTNICAFDERNFANYPLTPKTPHNDKFQTELPSQTPPPPEINLDLANLYYEQGYFLLHFAKPRDPVMAVENFKAAADLGSMRGKHEVAYCYQHGIGVNADKRRAVEIYLEIINAYPQSAASLNQLGLCFQQGIGVEIDEIRAINYYQRAVDLGNIDAMFNLAYCLRHGIGTPVDDQSAFILYLRLAELGDPQGMKLVGNCKLAGIGTPKDETEALRWFHQSSKCDFYWGGKMQYALCLLNSNSNYKETFRLIKEVCENFPLCPGPSKLLLGKCYHFGIGCTPDLRMALYWYGKALQSYFMSSANVQECERLISDIRIRNEFSTVPVVVKSERIMVDRSNGKATPYFAI
ncbi:6759_t:CDS:2, partial [Acaulospora morrowiae]